jgi:membrane protein YqaA with SNARE-associated domain
MNEDATSHLPAPRGKKFLEWIKSKAQGRYGEAVLTVIAFTESSVFIVPPDVVIIAMILSGVRGWKRIAALTTFASVLGGVVGYGIGYLLLESVGKWIIDLYSLEEEVMRLGDVFNENAFVSIFIAAFTPIPYKAFTISAGIFKIDLVIFILASLMGRGLRFFGVSYVVFRWGTQTLRLLEKYLLVGTLLFLLVILVALLL